MRLGLPFCTYIENEGPQCWRNLRGPSGRSAGGNDEQKRWEEASRLEEVTRELPSRDSEGLKGRDVAGFCLGIGGSAATQPKNIAELKGRTIGACHAHFETIGAGIFASTQPES